MGSLARIAVVTALLMSVSARPEDPAQRMRRPAASLDLRQLTERSGMIFLGRVEKIEWKQSDGGAPAGRVAITFAVLDGIRGAKQGESVEIEEWSGLWTPGNQRYQPGETLLLFFHPRSRLGLTSPVGGEAGRLEVTPGRRMVLSPERAETMLPRSLRLQKEQAALLSVRGDVAPDYEALARVVRELAEAGAR